jgi:hypothetical protein
VSRDHRRPLGVAAVVVATALACGGGGGGGTDDRRAEVAERSATVMPFDLDATTHRFEPRADGLVQTVVADDAGDERQVELVQEHLSAEAERFRRGDFDDPAAIHGHEMPGLAELASGAAGIDIAYVDLPAGGRITYTTEDPGLVEALHLWSDAQVRDHGGHAEHVE